MLDAIKSLRNNALWRDHAASSSRSYRKRTTWTLTLRIALLPVIYKLHGGYINCCSFSCKVVRLSSSISASSTGYLLTVTPVTNSIIKGNVLQTHLLVMKKGYKHVEKDFGCRDVCLVILHNVHSNTVGDWLLSRPDQLLWISVEAHCEYRLWVNYSSHLWC